MKINKTNKIILGILMIMPLLLAIIFYPNLPEKIPMHYGMNNQVDRWGSKNEIFLFPALLVVIGLSMQNITKRLAAKEQTGTNNQNLSVKVTYATLILLNLMFGYTLYTTVNGITDLNDVPVPLGRFTGIILGSLLIFIGNLSPKAKLNKNSWINIGFRTPWSKKNEETWRRTQMASGYVSIIAGLMLIISSFFVKAQWMPIVILVTILSFAIGVSIYSYWLAKKY